MTEQGPRKPRPILQVKTSTCPLLDPVPKKTYQVILDRSDANCRFPPLSLVNKVRIKVVCLGQRQGFSVFFIINLKTKHADSTCYTFISRESINYEKNNFYHFSPPAG